MDTTGLIAKEGHPFIAVALTAFGISFVFKFPVIISVILFGFFIFTVAFFRDPDRPCPGEPNELICPADGTIVKIARHEKDRYLGTETITVEIFMSPFNVHVNRSPLAGTVEKILYNPGRFLNAASPKASMENEQSAMFLRLPDQRMIVVNQIAGFVARRIVVRVRPGDFLARGRRFGMIRFGSRVDIHLPIDTRLTCAVGDRVYAGDTILGVISDETKKKG